MSSCRRHLRTGDASSDLAAGEPTTPTSSRSEHFKANRPMQFQGALGSWQLDRDSLAFLLGGFARRVQPSRHATSPTAELTVARSCSVAEPAVTITASSARAIKRSDEVGGEASRSRIALGVSLLR